MNVVNDLQMLPNSQFIENRVQEEPDAPETATITEPSASKVIDVMPNITESLSCGLKFIDKSFPQLTKPSDPLPDDSDDEMEEEIREQIRAAIRMDSISTLPLPAIIGSDNFNELFYSVVKKFSPPPNPVPDDYDLVDSLPTYSRATNPVRVIEPVMEAVEDRAEYDSDKESRVLHDMLDSDSDEDFKPNSTSDLFNVFNQSPIAPAASTPIESEDVRRKSSNRDLFNQSSDNGSEDAFDAPRIPEVTNESKQLSFKEELERKLGQKPNQSKVIENPVATAVSTKVALPNLEKKPSARSSTLFESDDSGEEEDFDIFKRGQPKEKNIQEPQVTRFKSNENPKVPTPLSSDMASIITQTTKSNQTPSKSSSNRGLFSLSSSSSEGEGEQRPSVPESNFLPVINSNKQNETSAIPAGDNNSINRSDLDPLQRIVKGPTVPAAPSPSVNPVVVPQKPKQRESKHQQKKRSLFDDSSPDSDDSDDLFKPKPVTRSKATAGSGSKQETLFEPQVDKQQMGGLISSLLNSNDVHRETATFHVNNNLDSESINSEKLNPATSSSKTGNKGKLIIQKEKQKKTLFTDEDSQEEEDKDETLFANSSRKKNKKTIKQSQQSETINNRTTINDSSGEGNLAKDGKRNSASRDSNLDSCLNLEPTTTTLQNNSSSPSVASSLEKQEREDIDDEEEDIGQEKPMDQKIAKISNLIGNKKPPPIGGVSMFGPGGIKPEDLKVLKPKPVNSEPIVTRPLSSPSSEDEKKKIEPKKSPIVVKKVTARQNSESKVTTVHIDASGMPRTDSIVTLGNQAIKTRPKAAGRRPPTRKTMPATILANGIDSESETSAVDDGSKSVKSVEELNKRLGKVGLFSDNSDEEDLFKKRPESNSVKVSVDVPKKSTLFDDPSSDEGESNNLTVHDDPKKEVEEEMVMDVVEEKQTKNSSEPSKTEEKKSKAKGLFDDDSEEDEGKLLINLLILKLIIFLFCRFILEEEMNHCKPCIILNVIENGVIIIVNEIFK